MKDIGTELETYLKTIPQIRAMIGRDRDARIYEERAKQGAPLPYIVYQVFDGTSQEHLDGIAGIASNRIQVDAYGINRSQAHELASKIRFAPLQMFRGRMGETFVNNVTSDGSYDHGSDPPVRGSGQRRYWTSRDYFLTYQEPTSS